MGTADSDPIGNELVRLILISGAAGMLSLTIGAIAGKGYLAAIGTLMVVVAVTQVAVLFGTGGWFPFAVPGLMAIAGSEGAPELNGAQIALVPALTLAGVWVTIHWWRTTEAV